MSKNMILYDSLAQLLKYFIRDTVKTTIQNIEYMINRTKGHMQYLKGLQLSRNASKRKLKPNESKRLFVFVMFKKPFYLSLTRLQA